MPKALNDIEYTLCIYFAGLAWDDSYDPSEQPIHYPSTASHQKLSLLTAEDCLMLPYALSLYCVEMAPTSHRRGCLELSVCAVELAGALTDVAVHS